MPIKPRVRLIIIKNNKLLVEYVKDEDFYFYPGGKVDPYETILQACQREMQEELAVNFRFQKILYIRDYIKQDEQEHSLEFFILGDIDRETTEHNPHNPDPKPSHRYEWIEIDKLPSNLLPNALRSKLQTDFKAGFPYQGEYLGQLD